MPTLAELLQSDTDTELLNLPTSPKLVNITESIPTLGSLLEDDDETQPAQGSPVKDHRRYMKQSCYLEHFLALIFLIY